MVWSLQRPPSGHFLFHICNDDASFVTSLAPLLTQVTSGFITSEFRDFCQTRNTHPVLINFKVYFLSSPSKLQLLDYLQPLPFLMLINCHSVYHSLIAIDFS